MLCTKVREEFSGDDGTHSGLVYGPYAPKSRSVAESKRSSATERPTSATNAGVTVDQDRTDMMEEVNEGRISADEANVAAKYRAVTATATEHTIERSEGRSIPPGFTDDTPAPALRVSASIRAFSEVTVTD